MRTRTAAPVRAALAVLAGLACGCAQSNSDSPEEPGPAEPGVVAPGAALDGGTAVAAEGMPCEADSDCEDAVPGGWMACARNRCGPPMCHVWLPCAAPPTPAVVCNCDGEVVPGYLIQCGQPNNYAYAIDPPIGACSAWADDCQSENVDLYAPGCDPEREPEGWTLRLEGSGLEAHDGLSITVGGDGRSQRETYPIAGGAVSAEAPWVLYPYYQIHVFIDADGDGECNGGEVAFEETRRVDLAPGTVTLTLTGVEYRCEDPPPPTCPDYGAGIDFACAADRCAAEMLECDEGCQAMIACQQESGCVGNECSCPCRDAIAEHGITDLRRSGPPGTSAEPWRRLNDCATMAGCWPNEYAGQLLVTEVDYRQPAGVGDFVEACNPGTEPLDLAGYEIQFLSVAAESASGERGWARLDGILPAGGCIVHHDGNVMLAGAIYVSDRGDDFLLDEAGTARILHGYEGSRVVVDSVTYQGVFDAFGEGEPTPADSFVAPVSIARCPMTADTDDNASDFVLLGVPTPGGPNACP